MREGERIKNIIIELKESTVKSHPLLHIFMAGVFSKN
jgi:hypothetical protein